MNKTFKNLFAIIIALVLFIPVTALAVTEIGQQDFLDARENEGEYTEKGVKYTHREPPVGEPSEGYFLFRNGEYKFTEDIDLGYTYILLEDADINLDLNGKSLSISYDPRFASVIKSENSNVVISGNGIINGSSALDFFGGIVSIENGTFNGAVSVCGEKSTINGGTYNGEAYICGGTNVINGGVFNDETEIRLLDSKLNINDGTFNRPVYIHGESLEGEPKDLFGDATINSGKFEEGLNVYHTILTINDGTFGGIDNYNSSLYFTNESIVKINGGKFISSEAAIEADRYHVVDDKYINPTSLEINGGEFVSVDYGAVGIYGLDKLTINNGSFQGLNFALYVEDSNTKITLTGGKFTTVADDKEKPAALAVVSKDGSEMASWVADGYIYSPELTVSIFGEKEDGTKLFISQREIEVVHLDYKVLEGNNQTIDVSGKNELKFRFNIPFAEFKESGKVYIDGKLVDPKNYTATEGSTIITFTKEFTKANIHDGNHTVKIVTDLGEVTASFKAINNPATVDNIIIFGTLFSGALAGVFVVCNRSRKYNN